MFGVDEFSREPMFFNCFFFFLYNVWCYYGIITEKNTKRTFCRKSANFGPPCAAVRRLLSLRIYRSALRIGLGAKKIDRGKTVADATREKKNLRQTAPIARRWAAPGWTGQRRVVVSNVWKKRRVIAFIGGGDGSEQSLTKTEWCVFGWVCSLNKRMKTCFRGKWKCQVFSTNIQTWIVKRIFRFHEIVSFMLLKA